MNEKLNLQELVSLLAQESGISKKDAEVFLREYFNLIMDSLLDDGNVKVKRVGTFKLTKVDDRESVDVNNGTRVLIPAHYKVNYTADTQLARKVNEPFALFEPMVVEDSSVSKKIGLKTKLISSNDEKNNSSIKEAKTSNSILSEDEKKEEVLSLIPDEKADDDGPKPIKIPYQPVKEHLQSNSKNTEFKKIWWKFIPLLIFVIGVGVYVYIIDEDPSDIFYDSFFKVQDDYGKDTTMQGLSDFRDIYLANTRTDTIEQSWVDQNAFIAEREVVVSQGGGEETGRKKDNEDQAKKEEAKIDLPFNVSSPGIKVVSPDEKEISSNIKDVIPSNIADSNVKSKVSSTDVSKSTTPSQSIEPVLATTKPVVANNVKTPNIKKRKIASGERLTLIALEAYGHKSFWVYLYEENRNVIKDPNNVPAGLEIIIPEASKYQIDKHDSASIKRANAIMASYKK
ncbi:HU family DNA-binding protein [Bacteroidales bacterium OttesenSCG-928-M06]|nr:HU family DNA-binding protein [Bacteroidales bacterium OttesenSCG-928-M06]